FVQALRALGGYRGTASFSTWLYAIAVNVCRGRLRRRGARERLTQVLAKLLPLMARPAVPEAQAIQAEGQAAVGAAIAAPPERQPGQTARRPPGRLRRVPRLCRLSDDRRAGPGRRAACAVGWRAAGALRARLC